MDNLDDLELLSKDELIAMLEERAEAGVKLSFPGKALARRISRKVRPHVQRTVAKYSAGPEAEQARNLLIERSRRKGRNESILFPLDEGRDAPVCPAQAWSIEASDLRRTLRRTSLAMPRRTRRIFLMHRLRSQTYREIANEVGIGEQGVEYHMMRALARCRTAAALHE